MAEWFIGPSGSSGNPGTIGSPWDLTSGLTKSQIKPGDVVWLRGGDYDLTDPNLTCSVVGLLAAGYDDIAGKIIYRVYNPTVVGTNPRDWLTRDADGEIRGTDIGTGDPSQTERFRIRATQSTATETSGALSVNGAHSANATTISIAKAAGVDQAVLAGHQIQVGTDRYLITAPTTIVQGTNTTVSVAAPNAAKSGGEAATLILNHSNIDTLQVTGKFVWFWDWENWQILKARTTPGYAGAAFSTFNNVTDGIKFINCITRDYAGSNYFIENTSGNHEHYGCISMNVGAQSPNDGGGHDHYLHHNAFWVASFNYLLGQKIEDDNGFIQEVTTDAGSSGATKPAFSTTVGGTTSDGGLTWTCRGKGSLQARYRANCMINAYSLQMQLYDTDPQPVEHVLWKNNISINAGQLCSSPNIGGVDADMFVMGGGTTGTIRKLLFHENFGFIRATKGSRAFNVSEGGGISGDGNEIRRNYVHIGGMGFSALTVGAFAAGGGLVHRENEYVVPAPVGGVGNGRCVELQTNGGAQFSWGGNIYYRSLGNGQTCGAETTSPLAFADATGAPSCRTLAQFMADCGFSGDIILPYPTKNRTFVVRADKFQKGRGYALYYNYESLSAIPICLRGLLQPGDKFVVHDVRDVTAGMRGAAGSPVMGTAADPLTLPADGIVNFPNTQVADPVPSGALQGVGEETAVVDTAPLFNCFLIQRIAPAAVTHDVEQRTALVALQDSWGE